MDDIESRDSKVQNDMTACEMMLLAKEVDVNEHDEDLLKSGVDEPKVKCRYAYDAANIVNIAESWCMERLKEHLARKRRQKVDASKWRPLRLKVLELAWIGCSSAPHHMKPPLRRVSN